MTNRRTDRNTYVCIELRYAQLIIHETNARVSLQLEQQIEAVELSNSILIEISKTAVPRWQEKLKTRYGWFKSNNCKNIIFDVSVKRK